ncbi:S8 family peptidase [Nonomuraea gerenzanensis]|uniref:Serine alkaline protease (Subtilisin E) n=1 Tax=Nonomuraea gerenzanensis TaxID=93944 RepID=A0A1M4ENW1_9ACTN|nr:S8 family serine peptidase [Nonomuraea gerenzanensis]UBU12031.1 S8 family serine peptidase [Nonomuraea gerenzanensis]SBP00546.1 serine alkaline protease (subtilisin E) [Nonomuraea gerenzanensis]
MRLRSLLVGATTLAMTSGALCAGPALQADTTDTGDPIISPALVTEIQEKSAVRSIIQLKPGQSVEAVAADLEQASEGSRVLEAAESPNFFVAELDGATLEKLKQDSRVQSVYKDELSMPLLDSSTARIRSVQANAAGWNGTGTTVAVLDTGIDSDHPFFTGRLADEACFSSSSGRDGAVSLCPNNQPSQTGPGAANVEIPQCTVNGQNACSHGSHVAGIAAGKMVTGAPANGVAPEARLLPIQVFSRIDNPLTCAIGGSTAPCFLSYTSDQKLALEYVTRVVRTYNIASVNMSLGGARGYTEACDTDATAAAVKPEFDALVGLGVAPVVAAGNAGLPNAVSSPACISTAVATGATDDADALAPFTNRGQLLDLFAPGVAVNSAVPDDAYGQKAGTSMAAPHVAGAFALMRQAFPEFTVAQSLQRLQNTGTQITFDSSGTTVIKSRIDMERATATTQAPVNPGI